MQFTKSATSHLAVVGKEVLVVGGLRMVEWRRAAFICGSILWIALGFGVCMMRACGVGVFKVCAGFAFRFDVLCWREQFFNGSVVRRPAFFAGQRVLTSHRSKLNGKSRQQRRANEVPSPS